MTVKLELTNEQSEVLRQFMKGRIQGIMATARSLGHPEDAKWAGELLMAVGEAVAESADVEPVEEEVPEQPEEPSEEAPDELGERDADETDPPEPEPEPEPLPDPLNLRKAKSGRASGSRARQGVATSSDLKG